MATVALRHRRRRRAYVREIVFSAILLAVGLVWIYPFLWMISAALKTNAEIFGGLGLIPKVAQWGNFIRAWNDAHVGRYFANSVITTVGSVAIVLITTTLLGYVLGRYRFPGKRLIIGALVILVFMPEGYTIVPVFELLSWLHLTGSLWGMILGLAGGVHVVLVLLTAGYFGQLPKELEESAVVDGAGFVRVFWTVMLPLAKPVLATSVILQFMSSWNSFLLPLVLTLTRPDNRTLAVGLYAFKGQYFTDYSGMAAASTISLLPIIAVFLVLQRYFIEGLTGAVKQ